MLAAGNYQLSRDVEVSGETGLVRSLDVRQQVDGLPVYQGHVSVMGRVDDGAAYIINNSLKKIGEFSKDIRVNHRQAETFLQSRYPGASVKVLTETVVFADGAITELGWVAEVNSSRDTSEQDLSLQIVVSAQSGEILYSENRLRN